MQTKQNFLSWEKESLDAVDFKKTYVDVAGDIQAGLLLSQIVYWFLPTKDGTRPTKTCTQFHQKDWLIKQRNEWWNEIRLSERQYDRAIKKLQEKNLVEIRTHKSRFHGGDRAHYIHLKFNILVDKINNISKSTEKCTNSTNCQSYQTVITPNHQNVISFNTKTLTENNKEKIPALQVEDNSSKKRHISEIRARNYLSKTCPTPVSVIDHDKVLQEYCSATFGEESAQVLRFSRDMRGCDTSYQVNAFTNYLIGIYGKDSVISGINELTGWKLNGIIGYYTPTYVREFFKRRQNMEYVKHKFREFCDTTFSDESVSVLVYDFYTKYLSTKSEKYSNKESITDRRIKNIQYLIETVGYGVFISSVQKFMERIKSGELGKGKNGPNLQHFTNYTKSFVKPKTQHTYLSIEPVEKKKIIPVVHHRIREDEKEYEKEYLNWYYTCPNCSCEPFDAWAEECKVCGAQVDWDNFDKTSVVK